MMVTLDFGTKVDLLTRGEVRELLREDAALRRALAGVESAEWFANSGRVSAISGLAVGTLPAVFTTPPEMVAGGFAWSVMNIGVELTSNVVARVYKGVVANITSGNGRVQQVASSSATPTFAWAKGQFKMAAGDQLTILAAGTGTIASVYITGISVPAERWGELLI